MTPESIVTVVSVCGMLASMFFALRSNKRADNKDVKSQAAFETATTQNLEHIIKAMDELKENGKDNQTEIIGIKVEIAAMKRDLKTVFSKIGELRGGK